MAFQGYWAPDGCHMVKRIALFAMFAGIVAGCAPAPVLTPMPTEAHRDDGRAVERLRLPDTATPAEVPGPSVPASAAQSPIVVPPNSLYVCVVDRGGIRQQTAIEFASKVGALCAKHPEMGPCQYERNACRQAGGRVYATGGTEITMETEALYDKKVMRVRFKGG